MVYMENDLIFLNVAMPKKNGNKFNWKGSFDQKAQN